MLVYIGEQVEHPTRVGEEKNEPASITKARFEAFLTLGFAVSNRSCK